MHGTNTTDLHIISIIHNLPYLFPTEEIRMLQREVELMRYTRLLEEGNTEVGSMESPEPATSSNYLARWAEPQLVVVATFSDVVLAKVLNGPPIRSCETRRINAKPRQG